MYPDLSGQEEKTAYILYEFLSKYNPTGIIKNLGGYGMLVTYEFAKEGPVIVIRCDLDALPINETTELKYKSKNAGVSHKCGHDGHMAITAGLAPWLSEQKFKKGKVVLLFQPAEETAVGAKAVLEERVFQDLNPDYIIGLHNLPAYPLNSVIVAEGQMSPAVTSLCIKLEGKVSHAAQPEKGNNPTLAISTLNLAITKLSNPDDKSDAYSLVTPVHTRIGTRDFGISPGEGEVNFTIRTWSDELLETLREEITRITDDTCRLYALKYSIVEHDYFPAIQNDRACNTILRSAAAKSGLKILDIERPFPFGEDFGWFTRKYKASLFGLGAGEDALPLHHADYDFNDELISPGVEIFKQAISEIILQV